jgi:hypothetical protein
MGKTSHGDVTKDWGLVMGRKQHWQEVREGFSEEVALERSQV